ncbi:hypothetical protein JCM6882_006327, partial [Rhodosporidiobolus microsporus]
SPSRDWCDYYSTPGRWRWWDYKIPSHWRWSPRRGGQGGGSGGPRPGSDGPRPGGGGSGPRPGGGGGRGHHKRRLDVEA